MDDKPLIVLSAAQREAFLNELASDKNLGNREALRRIGVTNGQIGLTRDREQLVTKAQVAAMFDADPDLKDDAQAARGRDLDAIEGKAFQIAMDDAHQHQAKVAMWILESHRDSDYRKGSRVELTGAAGGPIESVDRSARLDAVAAVLHATGALPELGGSAGAGVSDTSHVLAEPSPG